MNEESFHVQVTTPFADFYVLSDAAMGFVGVYGGWELGV
jgi:hypothetical protein